ncbi:hypothetical protein [Amphritea sp.]|uniref:hypothetical protein n=1 Tax=Amphritea sp. TaxID=1872502 RepID=UPI0025BBC161|nr:hypothetical protein [Amphritea sp.]
MSGLSQLGTRTGFDYSSLRSSPYGPSPKISDVVMAFGIAPSPGTTYFKPCSQMQGFVVSGVWYLFGLISN